MHLLELLEAPFRIDIHSIFGMLALRKREGKRVAMHKMFGLKGVLTILNLCLRVCGACDF